MKRGPKSKFSHISDEMIIEACLTYGTMLQAAKSLNMAGDHGANGTFIRRAKILEVYNPNQGGKGQKYPNRRLDNFPLEDILDGKYPQYKTSRLKHRLIKAGIKEDKCELCPVTNEWNGKPITLHLDHINGINYDHRLKNLRILCPNCHSQTETWCGRNK